MLPLIMGMAQLAGPLANAMRKSPDMAQAQQNGMGMVQNEQNRLAGQQYNAAQQGMLNTAAQGGSQGGKASAKMAALNAAPGMYGQAMANSAGAAANTSKVGAEIGAQQAMTQDMSNRGQDAGLGQLTKMIGGMGQGLAMGNMLSDQRAKVLEEENAKLKAQLQTRDPEYEAWKAEREKAHAADAAFIQQQIDSRRMPLEQAQADAPHLAARLHDPQMTSDQAAQFITSQPRRPVPKVASMPTPPAPYWEDGGGAELSDQRAKVLEGQVAKLKAQNANLKDMVSSGTGEAKMSSDAAADFIMRNAKGAKPAKMSPKPVKRDEMPSASFDDDAHIFDGTPPTSFSMFPTGFYEYGAKPYEPEVKAPPWESEGASPPWSPGSSASSAGPDEKFRGDMRKLLKGTMIGGREITPDEIESAIAERWREERGANRTSDERAKVKDVPDWDNGPGAVSLKEDDGAYTPNMRDPAERARIRNRAELTAKGPALESARLARKAVNERSGYGAAGAPNPDGSVSNMGRIWTSAGGDMTGAGIDTSTDRFMRGMAVNANKPGYDSDGFRKDFSNYKTSDYYQTGPISQQEKAHLGSLYGYREKPSPFVSGFERDPQKFIDDTKFRRLTEEPDTHFSPGMSSLDAARFIMSQPKAKPTSVRGVEDMTEEEGRAHIAKLSSEADTLAKRDPRYAEMVLGKKKSDETSKSGKTPGEGAGAEMVKKAPGSFYHYKDGVGEDPGKRHYGPMAQDLEKSEVGKTVVSQDPVSGFKQVDTSRLALAQQGALNEILKRIERLEGKKK